MQKIMALIFIMKFICGKCTGEKLIEEVSVKEKCMKFARNDVPLVLLLSQQCSARVAGFLQ